MKMKIERGVIIHEEGLIIEMHDSNCTLETFKTDKLFQINSTFPAFAKGFDKSTK